MHVKKNMLNENIILRNAPDAPKGLTPTIIRGWIDETERNAVLEHVKFVLNRLRQFTKRVPITPQIISQLNQERLRTGVGFPRFIKLNAHLIKTNKELAPKGLSAAMLAQWVNGSIKTALSINIEFVVDAYSSLPDGTAQDKLYLGEKTPKSPRKNRVIVTPDIIAAAQNMADTLGGGNIAPYLRENPTTPDGFTGSLLCHILSGRLQTISPKHLDFLLSFEKSHSL